MTKFEKEKDYGIGLSGIAETAIAGDSLGFSEGLHSGRPQINCEVCFPKKVQINTKNKMTKLEVILQIIKIIIMLIALGFGIYYFMTIK